MMELLKLGSVGGCWMPAAGCSKRKQTHTVIVECEDDLLISPPEEEVPQLPFQPHQEQQQQQEQHCHHLGLLDALDSFLLSRQNSGVFLKDPNICLADDWTQLMAAPASTEELKNHHPALQELYGNFESRLYEPAPTAAVSIIPLTPDQVSRLTGTAVQTQQPNPQLLIPSPVSMTTDVVSAASLTPPPAASAMSPRPRLAARRRRTVATPDTVDDDNDLGADDPEYRRRRERNNVAVRKSRAKSRAHEQTVDRTLGKLRLNNEDLRKKVESVVRELKFLKSLMHKTRIPLPPELQNALRAYPTYFDPLD